MKALLPLAVDGLFTVDSALLARLVTVTGQAHACSHSVADLHCSRHHKSKRSEP